MLFVQLIMCPDVEQNDLALRNADGQDNPVVVGHRDSAETLEAAFEGMKAKMRRKGIFFEITKNLGYLSLEFRMAPRKFLQLSFKGGSGRQAEHQSSSLSSLMREAALL